MKFLRQHIFFLLILKICTIEAAELDEGKITGGYEAEPHSNPYVVSLQSRTSYSYRSYTYRTTRVCTGSILSQRWILSSGHCVTDYKARRHPMDAIVGAHDLTRLRSSQIYPISRRIAHPYYRGGVGPYDISMMKTYRDIEFSRRVQPINLPMMNMDLDYYEPLLVTGWGALKTTYYYSILPKKLQEVDVNYLPFYECYYAVNKFLKKNEYNPLRERDNICTGPIYEGIAGCTGDSGAPLVMYKMSPKTESSSSSSTSSTTMSTTESETLPTEPTTESETTPTEPTTESITIPTEPTTESETTPTEPTIESEMTTTESTTESETTSTETTTAAWEERYTQRSPFSSLGNLRNDFRSMDYDDKMQPTIVGVLSWGVVPCGFKGAPTVYSNVSNYMDFINKHLYSL